MWYVIAGASHNTDIGPDSEAQISSPNDEVDEKTHEQYHPDERTIESQTANEKEATSEKQLNGKHENGKDHKTNTSVWFLSFKFDDDLMKPCLLQL